VAWLAYLETHAKRLYSQILDPGMVAAIALSRRLDDLPNPFTARDISQKGWTGLDQKATEKALAVLIELHHIIPHTLQTGGRPTRLFHKNPNLILSKSLNSKPPKGSKGGFEGFEGSTFRGHGRNSGR